MEFKDPENFRQHMKEDDHQSPHKMIPFLDWATVPKVDITDLRCRICDEIYTTLPKIAVHLHDDHDISKINLTHDLGVQPFIIYKDVYICLLCSDKFMTLRALTRHTQTHYQNYTCATCGKAYLNEGSFKWHLKHAHNPKVYCKKCKETFSSLEKKRIHLEKSQNCWLYSCPICGEKFISRTLKEKHTEVAHNVFYECPECPEVFKNYIMRQNHYVAAHTEKFKCSYCNKTFTGNCDLQNHMVRHTMDKTFPCEICAKEFSRKKNLQQHMSVHLKDKPYECKICPKQFTQRGGLKAHLSVHHPELLLAQISKQMKPS